MPDFNHFIFVDFENVQDVNLSLAKGKSVHVTLLIGAKQTKVPTKLATQCHSLGAQVAPIEVGGSGRNALDLTLAMYLGREIQRHPEANFVIVSRDHDFDPMIRHLVNDGVNVERVSGFAAISAFESAQKPARPVKTTRGPAPKPNSRPAPHPSASRPAALSPSAAPTIPPGTPLPPRIGMDATSDLTRRQTAIRVRLSNPTNKNRPSTQKALAAHLRASLGKSATVADVTTTMDQLTQWGVLSIDEQKRVVYATASAPRSA